MPFFASAHFSHRDRQSLSALLNSPKDIWIRKKTATWLLRLLEFDISMDDNFFRCCGWVLGGMEVMQQKFKKDLKAPAGKSREATQARQAIKAFINGTLRRPERGLEQLYDEHPICKSQLSSLISSYLEDWLKNCTWKSRSVFPRGFKKLFGLDEQALEICAFIWSLNSYKELEEYFEDDLNIGTLQNAHIMARILNIPQGDFRSWRFRLNEIGILDDSCHFLRLSDCIERAMSLGSMDQLQRFFCKPLPATDVPLNQFRLPPDTIEHALALMSHAGKNPAHLLLYGAPGTGKTSFASQIAATLGVKAWAVTCRETDNVKDRRVSLTACLHMSQLHPGSLILIDEAERLLDTDGANMEESSSKAWLNDLLEQKDLRIIWITNNVEHLDQAVRRRFSFSIHFHNLGKRESFQMWNNVAQRLNIEDRFPMESRRHFANVYQVPVAVMESAARQARQLAKKRDFCQCAERILKAHVELSHNGYWHDKNKTSQLAYDPDAICCGAVPGQLLQKLEKLHAIIRDGKGRGMGNLLFYGPPGTGKTAFAHYVAEKLECECLECKASSLLGSFVGETERNIASTFAQAERDGSVLLVDEADSFIFSREMAQRSWEQSMVNEFLTSLQNFSGICICTTNFRKIIDNAAMRRFPFKIAFNYAAPQQIEKLYRIILAPLSAEPLASGSLASITSQKHLTPGDFRAVYSQFWLEDPGSISHRQMMEALLKEQRLKLEKESKSVGF